MTNVCEGYNLRNEQHVVKQRFFTIMLGDYLNHLTVPRKFKEDFKGKWLDKMNLRGPSGETWTVEVVQTDQDLNFRTGWDVFAKDHDLNLGNFLVFEYSDNVSCFNVLILDHTACEREICYTVTKNQHLTTLNSCCERRVKAEFGAPENVFAESETDAAAADTDSHDGTFACEFEDINFDNAETNKQKFVSKKKRRGRPPVVAHDAKVVRKAECFRKKLKNANFLLRITVTAVKLGTMHFPAEFLVKSKNEGELQYIELRIAHKRWNAKVCTYNGKKSIEHHKLGHGFGKFVDDNSIRAGDVCVFEAAPADFKFLNVTIFRHSDVK